jgi:hypothetical protein
MDEPFPSGIDSFEVNKMKRTKNAAYLMVTACSMLLLIINSRLAFQGISQGIDLCIGTIIPSLFPLAVFSNLLTSQLRCSRGYFIQQIGKVFKMPEGVEGILIPGILGGYPLGAAAISNAHTQNQITKSQAHQMLHFCCNAGPSFIFGLAASLFSNPLCGWTLWGVQLISALLICRLFPPEQSSAMHLPDIESHRGITDAIARATRSMAAICAWIILFRMVIVLLEEWFLFSLPTPIRIILYGILEVSNGCISLNQIENEVIRFLTCAGFLGFGGLCVTMQTASVAAGLEIKHYLFGKILQGLMCVTLSIFFLPFLFGTPISDWLVCSALLFTALFAAVQFRKNNSRNLLSADV